MNGAHIDLEYGTDGSRDAMGMQHRDPDEDSLSMSDDAFGIHSPNAFSGGSRGSQRRTKKKQKRKMVLKIPHSSVDSSANISLVNVRGQKPKLKKISTGTSVDVQVSVTRYCFK